MTYLHEYEMLFENDPDVKVVYTDDNDGLEIALYVHGARKADALTQLLPTQKVFGNVTVKIKVVPDNDTNGVPSKLELLKDAFDGNSALSYIASAGDTTAFSFNYVVFAKKVVQFYNDQMDNPNGYKSTLYEDIARDIFSDTPGIFYTTDVVFEKDCNCNCK